MQTAAAASSGGTPWWLSLLLATIPLAGAVLGVILLRRTGKETVQVSEESLANAVSARLETRLSALELDKWCRREETMRMLRWATERATSKDDNEAVIGTRVLEALGQSELLQPEDQGLIDAVLDVLLEEPESAYTEASSTGDEVEVDLVDGEQG
ncbi:hypothetical protein [Quadrisphaera granulorum]|nr:hypothetical protein [Quadrisphaera granulorum]